MAELSQLIELGSHMTMEEAEAIVQADYASHEACRLRGSCDGCDQHSCRALQPHQETEG